MILIIDCGSNKTRFIEEIVDHHVNHRTVPLLDMTLADLEGAVGVIISGAPILVTEVDTTLHQEKLEWIKETELPVLGICFGHQLIGLIFGASANRMMDERDWQTIEAFEECILFRSLPHEVRMMEDHCESISIPTGFKLIASSDACINEVMQHEKLPIYGVQFHPEVSGNHGAMMIENFIASC